MIPHSLASFCRISVSLLPGLLIILFSACHQPGNTGGDPGDANTKKSRTKGKEGYSGVYKSYRDGYLYSEVTLKNGQKNGLAKRYYPSGKINTEIMYEDDIKVGTSKWYYTTGQVYRETPYENGKIHGIQKKYHKDGGLMAEIPYENGLRKIGLREIGSGRSPVTRYPSIEVTVSDRRSDYGRVDVTMRLSNNASKVKFYEGELSDSIFDPERLYYVHTEDGEGKIQLVEKADYNGPGRLHIVAFYQTRLGNGKIIQTSVALPSKKLKY